jgi:hypothetical protein
MSGVLRVYGASDTEPSDRPAEDRDREFSEKGCTTTFHLVTASTWAACACSTSEGCKAPRTARSPWKLSMQFVLQRCRLHQGLHGHHDDDSAATTQRQKPVGRDVRCCWGNVTPSQSTVPTTTDRVQIPSCQPNYIGRIYLVSCK